MVGNTPNDGLGFRGDIRVTVKGAFILTIGRYTTTRDPEVDAIAVPPPEGFLAGPVLVYLSPKGNWFKPRIQRPNRLTIFRALFNSV